MDYVTLSQVRAYLGLQNGETADDAKLIGFIRGASQFIDSYTRRRFDVRRETRLFDYPIKARSAFGVYDAQAWVDQMNAAGAIGAGLLRLDDDLLAAGALLNGDGTSIAATDYVLEPANASVHHTIRLLASSATRWLPGANGRREQVISVPGWWGYHDRYAEAWIDTLDTVRNNPLTAGGTSLSVSDADGLAEDRQLRFQAGQLLKLDEELVSVIAVSAGAVNTLTIKRAAQGTTAVEHAQGTPLLVYRPMENIVLAALRFTVWRYRQKDANVFDITTILGTGIAIRPTAVPADVLALLPAPKPLSLT